MRRANYFKIGLFVLGAAAILVVAVIAFGVGAFFRDQLVVETYFESTVQGLDIGSAVKFRGVQIGRVDTMTIVRSVYPTDHRYVMVRMSLDRQGLTGDRVSPAQIRREVEQGLRMRLGFQGVTGMAYIEVDYLDPERHPPLEIDWEPEYPYIPSSPSIITRVTDAVDGILRHLQAINVEGIASGLEKSLNALGGALEQADVGAIGAEAEMLLKELRETNRNLNAAVRELNLGPLIAEAEASFKGVRELAERSEPPLQEFLRHSAQASAELDQLLRELNLTGDLPESLAHLNRILTRLDRLMYMQEREIEETIENLRRMSENFRDLSERTRENPSQLFFGAPPPRRQPGERP